jgi:hypothetical protein
MKPPKCTSDLIYFIEDDELYSNRVSYEVIADSPVDAQDLAQQRVSGYHKVELALGDHLQEVDTEDYEPDSWYIVGGQGGSRNRLADSVRTWEALISF